MPSARCATSTTGFAKIYERLEDIYSEVYDIAATVGGSARELRFSPHELDDVESRLDRLYRLKKKYGPTVEEHAGLPREVQK